MPDPAGALITETRVPSVRTDSAAAAWSSRSPVCVRGASASCAWPVSAASSWAGSAPSARAACVAGQARRAARACLREHAFFHGQLRARGVAGAAVALVDAASVGAQQAARDFGWLGCFQADDRLELRPQGAVGQVFEQRGGRGGVHSRPGQHPAEVLDHIRAGPGALFLLRERDRLLRRAGQLELGGDRACCAARVRGGAAGCAVPDRRRDRGQAHAERARELVRPARVRLRDVERAVLGVACGEVGGLREVREFALGGFASVLLLELRGAGAQVGGDGLAAGGEQAHHLAADAFDLEAVAVVAGGPFQAEPAR